MNYDHRNQPRRGRQDHRPAAPQMQLGPFFDDQGNLEIEGVSAKAKEFALSINEGIHYSKKLNPTALRNFYNEFLRIKHLPENNNEEKKILIRLLVSIAHYKKNTANLPDRFVSFIETLINEVNDDLKKFDKACLVMEAIVGYFPK